jgi:NhaP-type Na+/H+ or K+/H+ antiporter
VFSNFVMALGQESPALAALAMLVLVLVAGTTAQIVAERIKIPATGPLLITGLVLGPSLLGLVLPELLGDGLRAIVRAAVAVCVFEGGLLLDVAQFRKASRAVVGLITVGLAITTVFAALLAHYLVGWSFEIALLFGALVSVTGPTVITPILQKVRVNTRVKVTLESESVIADPLGVILAALVFTAITSPGGIAGASRHALVTIGAGAIAGAGGAFFVWLIANRFRLLPAKFARLMILGTALLVYTIAELVAHEAGVLAAAIAGIGIGSLDIPHKQQVEEFKGDIASIAISAVFILHAASLTPRDLADLGLRGAAVVALIMLVVRPTRVFLSTIGSELRTNEKLFISFLGPRGIVAASVATFFSLELVDLGYREGQELVALVFGVVLATVLIQGSAAGWLARKLNVMAKTTIIVGADETGRLLAEGLAQAGEPVSIIDSDPDLCQIAMEIPNVAVHCADATDQAALKRAGAEDAKVLIAATPSDKANLLVCQIASSAFGVPRLVGRANLASNVAAFEASGIETMSPASAAATILENMVLRPNLFRLLMAGVRSDHVAEVRVGADGVSGQTLADLHLRGCVVAVVRRAEKLVSPQGRTRLRTGDVITLLGSESAIRRARERLEGR